MSSVQWMKELTSKVLASTSRQEKVGTAIAESTAQMAEVVEMIRAVSLEQAAVCNRITGSVARVQQTAEGNLESAHTMQAADEEPVGPDRGASGRDRQAAGGLTVRWESRCQKSYFIGAGPGDAELITVKGARLLQEADLVVFAGSLVDRELVRTYARDAEVLRLRRHDAGRDDPGSGRGVCRRTACGAAPYRRSLPFTGRSRSRWRSWTGSGSSMRWCRE